MSDTARMLDETAERLLSRHFATAVRGSAESVAMLLDSARGAGLHLVLASEDAGGFGAGTLEASAIAYRWGYHAAPGPIVALLMANVLSGTDGLDDPTDAAFALTDDLKIDAGGWRKPERACVIPAANLGEGVSRILVGMRDVNDNLVIAVFDADKAESRRSLAGEDILALDLSVVEPLSLHSTERSFEAFSAQAALLSATAIIGATQKLLEIGIEHANTRKQFGKPLGKFQAIQNTLADAAAEHVVAQACVRAAVIAEGAGILSPLKWRAAKIQAGRAATVVAAATHQILGAIGFTEEHVLNHYSKRLWIWRDEWGRQAQLERAVGADACANADRLWSWMVD